MSIFRAKLSTPLPICPYPTRMRKHLFLIAMKTYNVIYFAQIRKYFCIYRKNAVNLQRKYVIINHFKILTL